MQKSVCVYFSRVGLCKMSVVDCKVQREFKANIFVLF